MAIITYDTNIDVEHVEHPLGVDLVFLRKPWGFPPLFVYPRSSSSSRRLRFLIKCSLALRPKKGLKPPEIDYGELPLGTKCYNICEYLGMPPTISNLFGHGGLR